MSYISGGGGGSGEIVINSTPIVGGTVGNVLMHGAGDVVREYEITGTGKVVMDTEPLIISPSMQGFEELGPELVTNGGFTGNADGWMLGTGWAYDTNKVTHTSPAEGALTQDLGSLTTAGRYQVQFTVSGFSGVATSLQLGNGGDTFNFSANGSYSEEMTAGNSGLLSIDGAANTFSIDDVSVKEILSGPASRFLFGDDEVGLQVELAAIGTGNNPAKIEIDADGNLNLVNSPGALVGIRDANEGFIARLSTGNLTDSRIFTFQDLGGDLLVSGGFADFTNVLLDHNPTDNTPALNLQAFWNDGGVAFRGLFIDIIDTASDPTSRPLGIDIDGVEVFTVRESEMYVLGDLSSDGSVFAADVQSDTFVRGQRVEITDGTFLVVATVPLNNGAGASAGTLLNAPAAGDPTKWIPVDDDGTTRHVPAW